VGWIAKLEQYLHRRSMPVLQQIGRETPLTADLLDGCIVARGKGLLASTEMLCARFISASRTGGRKGETGIGYDSLARQGQLTLDNP